MARSLEAVIAVLLVVLIAVTGAPLARERWRRKRFRISNTQAIESRVDGGYYRVHTAYSRPDAAADFLALIHGRCIDLMEHMRAKYLRAGPKQLAIFPERAAITRRILDNYDPDALMESAPHNPDGDTSYSIDKGRVIAVCLRERHAHEIGAPDVYDLHDVQTVLFVVMHELAHLGTVEFGHPPQFWNCFRLLLAEAVEAGVVPSWPDYARAPVRYCGISVDYSPLFDPAVVVPT